MSNDNQLACVVCYEDKERGAMVLVSRDGRLVATGEGEAWPCCAECWDRLKESPTAVLERVGVKAHHGR